MAAHKISCRLCMDMDENLMSIFEVPDLEKLIEQCVQIKILPSDYLPTNICFKCISEIQNWTSFKNTCDQSQKILLKTIKKPVVPISSSSMKHILNDCTTDMDLSLFEGESWISELEKEDANISVLSSLGLAHSTPFPLDTDRVPEIRIPSLKEELVETARIGIKNEVQVNEHITSVPPPDDDLVRKKPQFVKNIDRCYQVTIKPALQKSTGVKTKIRSLRCELCSKTFLKFAKLLEHDYLKHKDILDSRAVRCSKCSHVFLDQMRLEMHMQMKHADRPHKCLICENAYGSLNSLRVHMYQHSDQNKCSLCPKGFNSKTHLQYHMDRVHYKNKPHSCRYCEKTFVSKCDKGRHERLVHLRIAQYKCDSCEMSFKTAASLNNHILCIHKKEKSFICEICAEGFKTRTAMLNHKKVHDSHIDVFKCPICKKALMSHQGYKMHIKTHRDPKQQEMKTCHICDRQFRLKTTLKCHIKNIHMGKSSQVCKRCQKPYKKRHSCMVLVKTNGVYSCKICDSHYGTKNSLIRHCATVHEDNREQVNLIASERIVSEDRKGLIDIKKENRNENDVNSAPIESSNGIDPEMREPNVHVEFVSKVEIHEMKLEL